MKQGGFGVFLTNLRELRGNFRSAYRRHGPPTTERARSQTVFNNFFQHIHATRVHPHSLRVTATWGLGVALASLFFILTATGVLLMVYYKPSTALAYDSIKDLHYIVPTGRFIRNIHRWAGHMMVVCVILHMTRVFYTAAYKSPREFNWVMGMCLLVLTFGLSFTGYLLPWDQLAYWAVTIGANIAASPNELIDALGLPPVFRVGTLQKELLLGSSSIGEDALIRFYVLHVFVLPMLVFIVIGAHVWRVRKDGGLARPGGSPTPAGKGVGTMDAVPAGPAEGPTRSFGLMCVVRDKSPAVGVNPDETVPSWPFLMRAELVVFMGVMLLCLIFGLFFDAPLKEPANPMIPENPAKAPWYFLGLQEMVSYSAFVGGILIPSIVVIGLTLIPFLDREEEECGVWFSGAQGRRVTLLSVLVGTVLAVLSVAIPVSFGWLRDWFPDIPQIVIIIFNPGSILTVFYAVYSLIILNKMRSTRMGALALFTCFLVGFAILTYVGTYLRGPNWDFYWSQSQWPIH
ncbi:MAG: cytochrome b N-terminal domain-containing protein [Verrucomicrobia bacterium]|nr:cytochrome b N-terminal domain-containing protein [Verrucomicrobiota bacterium]MDA1086562.1 cytochrome b N-terminal domain-containing protein [Verrucomicrobiota bacterium]